MPRGESITRRDDRITTNYSSSDADNHKSLGVDKEQVLKAHASTHNAVSSSVMSQYRGGVPL